MNQSLTKVLYSFLGAHSFLIGLFVFFLPIILLEKNVGLSGISFFIALTGFSFCIGLYAWDRIRTKKPLSYLIIASFIIEAFLVGGILFLDTTLGLYMSAVLYGIYNCFFWVTKRAIFVEDAVNKRVGNSFGNIQIVAFFLVKVGTLIGATLLDREYGIMLWVISLFVTVVSIVFTYYHRKSIVLPKRFHLDPAVQIKDVLSFKDKHNSQIAFILDGPFLFFESFFWIISLYTLSNESYTNLSIIIIVLALLFAISFYGIKTKIDNIRQLKIYLYAVLLYVIAWIMRGTTLYVDSLVTLAVIVLCITFFTTFFRLSFNKQFFELTKKSGSHKYMIVKSYYSQLSIVIIFTLLGFLFLYLENQIEVLFNLYFVFAIIASGYLFYRSE